MSTQCKCWSGRGRAGGSAARQCLAALAEEGGTRAPARSAGVQWRTAPGPPLGRCYLPAVEHTATHEARRSDLAGSYESKVLVGMARAPVGTSSAKAALLTVDQVLQVKGGLPWSAQTAAALYGRLQGCSERNMLADGNLHTAKKIPKDLRRETRRRDWPASKGQST